MADNMTITVPDEVDPWSGIRRLVAVVPDAELNEAQLAQRVWLLAQPHRLEVLYVGLAVTPENEARLLRRLATLAAITRTAHMAVETWVQPAPDRPLTFRTGDLVFIAPDVPAALPAQPSHAPTIVHWQPRSRPRSIGAEYRVTAVRRLIFWSVALATLIGFVWLQAQLAAITADVPRIILLLGSIIIEFAGLAWWSDRM